MTPALPVSRILAPAAVWCAVAVTWELFLLEIEGAVGFLGVLATLAFYASTVPLVLAHVLFARDSTRWRAHLLAALVPAVCAVVLVAQGRSLANWSYLERHRDDWLHGTYGGHPVTYDRLLGHPVRAFPVGMGFIDNWCAFVHDPSEQIVRVNAFAWSDPAAEPWRKLFGGDLTGCRRQDEAWFFCCFT